MKRRAVPQAKTVTDSVLREILESDDYKAALKSRMLAGKATASEIGLARDLGLAVPVLDRQDEQREALRSMDVQARRMLTDLLRLSNTIPGARRLRVIKAGSIVGLGYDTSTDAILTVPRSIIEPTTGPQRTDEDSLLPPKATVIP